MSVCYSTIPPQFWEIPEFWLFAFAGLMLLLAALTAAYARGRHDQQRAEETPQVFVVEAPVLDERLAMIQEQAAIIIRLEAQLAEGVTQIALRDSRIVKLETTVRAKETLRARYFARIQRQQQAARAVWGQVVAAIDHGSEVVLA